MHEAFSVTPGDDADGTDAADAESLQPIRPVTPLVRLGAPVVGNLEPSAPVVTEGPSEPADEQVEPATEPTTDTGLLRRAALLRLVGLGRSRSLR